MIFICCLWESLKTLLRKTLLISKILPFFEISLNDLFYKITSSSVYFPYLTDAIFIDPISFNLTHFKNLTQLKKNKNQPSLKFCYLSMICMARNHQGEFLFLFFINDFSNQKSNIFALVNRSPFFSPLPQV